MEKKQYTEDQPTAAVVLSIHPQYAQAIYQHKKALELRKRPPKIPISSRVWIYETAPVYKVTGYFTFIGFFRKEKTKLWQKFHKLMAIEKTDYDNYFRNSEYAYAWLVYKPRTIKPRDITDFGMSHPPQYFAKTSVLTL